MKSIAAAIFASILLLLANTANAQNMQLGGELVIVSMVTNGVRNQSFYDQNKQLDCGMPELYIYPDSTHGQYNITSNGILITNISSEWYPISSNLTCQNNNCILIIKDQCSDQKAKINWIVLDTSIGQLEYLVNCQPDQFYKPFEWGLFILIIISSVAVTISSLYSKAWSYGGVGYEISLKFIALFNFLLIIGIILAFFIPDIISLAVMIIGSISGAFGVTVCMSEIIWLFKQKKLLKKIFWKVRIIDLISASIGLILISFYWLLNGQWIINDILAMCAIVALIKLIKVRSLFIGVVLLSSLLIMEIVVGVFVHYVFKTSYNNYVINTFQSPIVLVLPSITHQLYRKCAWLPISSILFPGLVLSYFRRFDLSRGTILYLLIGLLSFYFGSVIWMIVDLQTIHSLPFAIISQPVTIAIVAIAGFRRNQFKTIWRGNFHDEQLSEDIAQNLLKKETEIVQAPLGQLTANLKLSVRESSEQIERISFPEQENK